jgi:hypothetical protein
MPAEPVKVTLVFSSEEWEWSIARTHAVLPEGVVTSNSFLPHLSDFIIRRRMQHAHGAIASRELAPGQGLIDGFWPVGGPTGLNPVFRVPCV